MKEFLTIEDAADNLVIFHVATVEKLFALSADAFTLYAFYYKTAKWQKNREIYAINDYVKKHLKWGTDRLATAKKQLVTSGFITVKSIQNQQTGHLVGKNIIINWTIVPEKPYTGDTIVPEKPYTGLQETEYNIITEYDNIVLDNNKNARACARVKADCDFDDFWQQYKPVHTRDGCVAKGSRKVAHERYQRAIANGAKHQDIIAGLQRYLAYCESAGRFSCGAPVFLSQERWKDEYETINDNMGV